MFAFIEWLCEHAGIIRVGPKAKKYGDPFDFAVAILLNGQTAIIKGLVADGKFRLAHAKAIISLLETLGYGTDWERIK